MILNSEYRKTNIERRSDLDSQTLELLEFNIIREDISKYAKSPGGENLILEQGFYYDQQDLSSRLDIVSDWKTLLSSELKTPDMYFPEIDFIGKLEKSGTVLEGIQLADAAVYIKSSILLKKFCIQKPENLRITGALSDEAVIIPELKQYSDAVLKEINTDGTVKDNHPELKNARSRIAGLHGRINKITSSYFSDNSEIWQSGTATQRDGRIVLPVKSNYRGRIKGLVHEVSSSGATVFVEPFDLVELNNDMAYEQGMLNQLIFKIYRGLTDKLREASAELNSLIAQVSYIDSWYARAVYSLRNSCIRPLHINRGITIKKGRHPLLGKNAVPISLTFADDLNILIITGPNAGGKTVTLKTCGLFVLLNQFAAELPAEEGTAIGIFNNIFADIGDDQSIEESLSTFSGHMKRISEVVAAADGRSLVLLDELGSGTDPSQGSAIAMGVLDHLRSSGVSTIVTTHHAAVKNFGYTHKGAVNASVAFDAETMKPTYEIIEGVPGESHAVEIAQSMGLPEKVIKRAEEYLENGDATVSEMIRELEKRQHAFMERERKLASDEKDNIEDRRKLDLAKLKLKQSEQHLKRQDYSMLNAYVKESRRELENLVRELREGEITREKTKKVKNHISELDKKLESQKNEINNLENELNKCPTDSDESQETCFEAGVEVIYKKNNKTGILVEQRKNNSWLVAFGNIKLTINEAELKVTKNKKTEKAQISGAGIFKNHAVFEMDIRGMRVYEAENALEKQIDSALLNGLSEFSIIHGLGEGVLQKTVYDFLRTCRAVKNFEYSDPEQGGFGKTIVKLQ